MKNKIFIYNILFVLSVVSIFFVLNQQMFHSRQAIKTKEKSLDTSIDIEQIERGILAQLKFANTNWYNSLHEAIVREPKNQNAIRALQQFWKDSAKVFLLHSYYVGKEAVLTKNEQILKQTGNFFYDNMRTVTKPEFKKWFALQAKEFLENAVAINPNNDSAQVLLGATLLFGEMSESPMQAVSLMRNVVEKDSTFVFGQKMLGMAALISGQLDKARLRFAYVEKQNPNDIENLLVSGEIFEKLNNSKEAIRVYQKVVRLTKNKNLQQDLKQKINTLSIH